MARREPIKVGGYAVDLAALIYGLNEMCAQINMDTPFIKQIHARNEVTDEDKTQLMLVTNLYSEAYVTLHRARQLVRNLQASNKDK